MFVTNVTNGADGAKESAEYVPGWRNKSIPTAIFHVGHSGIRRSWRGRYLCSSSAPDGTIQTDANSRSTRLTDDDMTSRLLEAPEASLPRLRSEAHA